MHDAHDSHDSGGANNAEPRGVMSFGDHLDELRKRLILAVALPLPLAVVAFLFAPSIRAILCEPAFAAQRASGIPPSLQVLNPVETIGADMHLALVVALILSAPWILWQAWKFVEPGLYASEKRFVRMLVPMSAALTVIGMLLLYFVMLPLMLKFLVSFGGPAPVEVDEAPPELSAALSGAAEGEARPAPPAVDGPAPLRIPIFAEPPTHLRPGDLWLTPAHELRAALPAGTEGRLEIFSIPLRRLGQLDQQFRLREYLDFVLTLMLAVAIGFQLPLVVLLLGWIGVIEVDLLRRYRRHAVFICIIAAAIITPTVDPVSMMLMAIPLYLLYELGIVLLVVAPPRAVAEGSVMNRVKDLALGRGRIRP
ncbi:MAG: twin-arginine translocase subunit TatC [Phycisphaeraceae bacterium]|nr:twin-arginine translocase subunit TatC [Phycisphaeraceae bacterium]